MFRFSILLLIMLIGLGTFIIGMRVGDPQLAVVGGLLFVLPAFYFLLRRG